MTPHQPRRGKIVFVCEQLSFGGGERLVASICRHCRDEGWVVELLAEPRESSVANSFEAWFSQAVDAVTWLPVAAVEQRLKVLTATDVVAVNYFYPSRLALLAPIVAGLRRDVRQTAFLFSMNRQGGQILRQIAPALDLIIAESLEVLRELRAIGLERQPARLIPSRVPPVAMRPPHAAAKSLRVGYIGRLSHEKNPMAVLAIAASLPRAGFCFTMIGDGGMRPRVALTAALLRLRRNVRFLGHLAEQDLPAAFDALDVILVPSRMDGRPLVIQEAQWRGVVVVASRVGGIPELVSHEQTGLLCQPGDADDFARQLLRLAADPALRNRLAGAARHWAEMDESIVSRLARFTAAISGSDLEHAAFGHVLHALPESGRGIAGQPA